MLNLSNKVKTNLVHLAGLRVTGSIPNVVKRFNSLPGVDALEYNHVNLNTLARYTGDGIKKGRVKRWKRVYESWQSRIVLIVTGYFKLHNGFDFRLTLR